MIDTEDAGNVVHPYFATVQLLSGKNITYKRGFLAGLAFFGIITEKEWCELTERFIDPLQKREKEIISHCLLES